MANPRNDVDFTDIEPTRLTFKADGVTIVYDKTKTGGSAAVGLACRLMPGTAKTVETVGDAEHVLGQIEQVFADSKVSVRVEGVLVLPGGASATLTPGSKIVGALGAASAEGYVRSVAAATLAEVAVAEGFILDATDATSVKVWF